MGLLCLQPSMLVAATSCFWITTYEHEIQGKDKSTEILYYVHSAKVFTPQQNRLTCNKLVSWHGLHELSRRSYNDMAGFAGGQNIIHL